MGQRRSVRQAAAGRAGRGLKAGRLFPSEAHRPPDRSSGVSSFTQRAGEAALAEGEPFIAEMVARLKENRDYCLSQLCQMPGVTVPKPEGAFYLFPRIEGLSDSFAFCKELLLKTRVGLAPGVAFGAGGEGSVRICYAAERNILEPAMDRLGEFVRTRRS